MIGPRLSFNARGAEIRDKNHFFFYPDQEAIIDFVIISVNNITTFQVNGSRGEVREGEVLVKKAAYYSHNQTTIYSLMFPLFSHHDEYTILFRVKEIDVEMQQVIFLSRKRGILNFFSVIVGPNTLYIPKHELQNINTIPMVVTTFGKRCIVHTQC